MKKKYLYVSVLFVMCIGLMIPTNVFAKSTRNFNGYVTVDYRFFVENGKNNENVKNLNFRLYDQTDAFSFQSEYNPNLENYYFIESYRINKSFYQGDIKYNNGDEKAYTMFESYDSSIMDSLNNAETFNDFQTIFNNEKISGSCSMDENHYGWHCHALHTIPMVLEEINHEGEGQAIKKIVFATLEFTLDTYDSSSASVYFTYAFYIQNNSCSMLDQYDPNSTDYSNYSFFPNMLFIRETSLEYSEDLISAYAIGTFSSEEVQGEEFFNKKMSSSDSTDNQAVSIDNTVSPRTESDNYNEQNLKDYCDCLPVFIQKRIDDTKDNTSDKGNNNIIDIITNPNTGGGICVLLVSIITVIGIVSFYLKRKKEV